MTENNLRHTLRPMDWLVIEWMPSARIVREYCGLAETAASRASMESNLRHTPLPTDWLVRGLETYMRTAREDYGLLLQKAFPALTRGGLPHTLLRLDQPTREAELSAKTVEGGCGLRCMTVASTATMGNSSLHTPMKMGWWTTLSCQSVKTIREDCGLGHGMASHALMEVDSSTIPGRKERGYGRTA